MTNIIYRLADGRLWDVRNACWLDEAMPATLSPCDTSPAKNTSDEADIIDLVSASGESSEAYLVKTLEFYKFPLGELALASASGIRNELERLDAEFLTPRTLAGLAANDPEAAFRWREHEEKAEPLRMRLRNLLS